MKSIVLTLAFVSIAALTTNCGKKKASTTTDGASQVPTSGTGSNGTFTSSDLSGGSSKQWISNCISSTDSTLGTVYYKQYLTLTSSNTFSFQQYMYTTPSGSLSPCANPDYDTVFSLAGAYSVGSSLSSGVQLITFVTTSSYLTATSAQSQTYTAVQNIFNNDCGGTSPYCTLSGGSCTNNGKANGAGQDSSHMNCQHYTFSNPAGSSKTLYNSGSYANSTLTLGVSTTGLPGILSTSVDATPSIAFH